jgi:hypothetical protein
MSFYPHTRQLGSQPGFQLNPVRDNTDGFVTGVADQSVAFVGRFKRGRIDVPFKVNRGNLKRKLGAPESLRVSALNECYVQVYEAVNNGAREAVISRLSVAGSTNSYAVFSLDEQTGTASFKASALVPAQGSKYVFYLKDLECFNDGILLEVNAPRVTDNTGEDVATKLLTLRIREPDGTLRYEVTGSLDDAAVDEYGQDNSLVARLAKVTPNIQIWCAQDATITPKANCYGKAIDGSMKLAKTAAPLVLFSEGGTAYANTDYDRVLAALEASTFDYGYASTGGTQATALVNKLATLNIRANRNLAVDVPGELSAEAAQTWVKQLGIDSPYVSFYWAPLRTDDPLNGGRGVIGTSGYQVGLRCARNAQTNSYGLSPKNYPIAGADWPLNRTGVEQISTPDEFALSDLADARINPVIYQTYDEGQAGFVFSDSLTSAQTSGYLKLISVAEMSSTLDDKIAKAGKKFMQLPMEVAISRMDKYLEKLFKGARASNWLVKSEDPVLGEKGWAYTVARNEERPADRMDVNYGTHFDGVTRAIYAQQTISA